MESGDYNCLGNALSLFIFIAAVMLGSWHFYNNLKGSSAGTQATSTANTGSSGSTP
jgi:hypothetical protein